MTVRLLIDGAEIAADDVKLPKEVIEMIALIIG